MLRPILTDASPAWIYSSMTQLISLQNLQNNVLRLCTNTPLFIRKLIKNQRRQYSEQVSTNSNKMLSTIITYEASCDLFNIGNLSTWFFYPIIYL
jgi:hypothetical protein